MTLCVVALIVSFQSPTGPHTKQPYDVGPNLSSFMFFIDDHHHQPRTTQGIRPIGPVGEDAGRMGGRLSLSFILNDHQLSQYHQQQQQNAHHMLPTRPIPTHPQPNQSIFSAFRRTTMESDYSPLPSYNERPFLPDIYHRTTTTVSFPPPACSDIARDLPPARFPPTYPDNTLPVLAPLHNTKPATKIPLQSSSAFKKKKPKSAITDEGDLLALQLKALKEKAITATTTTITHYSTSPGDPTMWSSDEYPEEESGETKGLKISASSAGEEIAMCRRNKQLVQDLLDSPFDNQAPSSNEKLKQRERATPLQVAFLEKIFALDPLPSAPTRMKLADKLGMTPKRIQIWFQNRRARIKVDKKITERCESFRCDAQTSDSAAFPASWSNLFEMEKMRAQESGASKKKKGQASFTFHNLARSDDGQLILRSEGAPSLILRPSLHKEKI